ncbi:MAG: T9SS type A sorting domain-containing protein [Saprospiraceae bacterium]
MKKHLPIFILLLLFPFLLLSNLPAENTGNSNYDLASSAGTMNLDEITLCDGDGTFIPHNGDETLDAGDIIKAVIHDNNGTILGNIFGDQMPINTFFSVAPPGIISGTTYYISAIAGMDDGTGNVDLTDPELSVAEGTPIVFVGSIETFFSAVICEGEVLNVGTNVFSETGTYSIVLVSALGCDSIIFIALEVLDPQAAIFPVIDMIDCSGTPVTVSAVVINPSPAIFYVWSGPCFTQGLPGGPNINVTCGGTYTLEVHEILNGVTCISETVSVEIFENITPPVVDAGPDLVIDCVNSSVTPFATVTPAVGPFAYAWTGANGYTANTQSPTFTTPGQYCFFAINLSTSCVSNTDCITVTADISSPTAVASSSNDLDCNNPSAVLTGFGSSMGSNMVYEWIGPSGAFIGTAVDITVVTPGQYTLVVTDAANGCSAEASVIVLENSVQPVAVITSSGDIDCNNTSVILDGSESIGNSLNYSWSTGENAISIEAFIAGTYTLTVIDLISGCTDETSIVVDDTNTFQVDLGTDTFFPCDVSEMVVLGNSIPTGSGFTYLWTTVDGSIVSGEDTAELTINSAGTYVLTVNDVLNNCTGADEIVINDFNDLLTVTENLTLNCILTIPNELEASFLFPNLDISYSWTTADGNFTSATDILNPTVDANGTYVLEVTDNLTGCTAEGSVIMSDPIVPSVVIEPQGNSVISCLNTVVVLDASGSTVSPPVSFEWSTNGGSVISTGVLVTVDGAGVYDLVVTDINGCSSSESYMVTTDIDPPAYTLPSEIMLNCNNNFEEEVGPVLSLPNLNVSYEWIYNGVVYSSDSSIILTESTQGIMELTVTNLDNGCLFTNIMEISYDGFAIDVTTTPAGCDLEDGTATASTTLTNTLVEWSNGEEGNTITDLAQGWYSVTVTDTDNNCSRHENFFVDEDISCKVVISGYVLSDPNNTCTYDVNLVGVECVMIKLDPLGIFTMTDATGYYEFIVEDGSYTVEYIGNSAVDLECPIPGTYDVTLNTNGSISGDNHFYVSSPPHDLSITKYSGNARPGFDQFNCLQICNNSATAQDAVVTFMHDSIFSDQTPWPYIYPAYGNTIAPNYTYDETTNTFTWNLDDLASGECRKIMWFMPVPLTAVPGYELCSEAQVDPIANDATPANNVLAWKKEVTASYDPNDKRNFVGDSEWGGAIYEDDITMEYAIRFQNVGTDTAFTVVVRDTLDEEHLDVTTVRGFTASHDMVVQFEDSNVLVFTFNNILLVDSMTNEPASNGWISFDIDRKPNQTFGTEITNQAAIYFDFNAPVITNELVNVLTNPVSIFSPIKNTLNVEITPTITNDEVQVNYVLEKTNTVSMQIYNVGGVLLQDVDFGKKLSGEHLEHLSLKDFTAGVYFIFVKTEESSAVGKVVKM